jgi:hypothetical protein
VTGDVSLKNMKRSLVICSTLIVVGFCFAAGYVIGGLHGGAKAAASTATGTLVWLTSIHKLIQTQKYDKALSIADQGIDSQITSLQAIRTNPKACFLYALPGTGKLLNQQMLPMIQSTKEYFLDQPDRLSQESMTFLATVPDAKKK